jgi:hypothetical protein
LQGDIPILNKLGFLRYVLGGLSFIPLCGIPFGITTILLGLFSLKRGGKTLVIIGSLGISFTVALYAGLFYFGFIQRGGIYDYLRVQNAENELPKLVQAIEFYKLQNSMYPHTLDELAKSEPKNSPIFIYDPTAMGSLNSTPREFFYELKTDGSGYFLLGVGKDGKPFTSDDILPKIDAKNIGLLINPSSKPNH